MPIAPKPFYPLFSYNIIRFSTLCLLCISTLLLQSCTAPIGTTHVYSVKNTNPRALASPLQPVSTKADDKALIYQTTAERQKNGDDIFSIYLTDSYLKYLQDFGGLNEVLIVAEFTEVVSGDPKRDTVVKILGPYTNIADATKAPLLNKLIYGPKRMESNILSLKLQVYEYDRGESEDNAAMLDFISASADALSLANPITLAEIAVAKEIGKALIAANDNDLVMTIDMDFVAGTHNMHWQENSAVHILPLKAGEMLLIKQEACRVGTCFDYFSKNGSNKLGLIPDAVMLAPTAVVRAITDVPDHDGLIDIDESTLEPAIQGLRIKRQGAQTSIPYKDKTWLRLAIVKGGDASNWDQRKLLWGIEADVDGMIRQKEALDSTKVRQLGEKLQEVVAKSKEAKAGVSFSSNQAINATQYWQIKQQNYTTCVSLPTGSIYTSASLPGFTISETTSPVGYSCFSIKPGETTTVSEHLLEVRYQQAGSPKATHLPIKLVEKPSLSDLSCTTTAEEGSTIKATVSNPEQAINWHLYGQDYIFSHTGDAASLTLAALAAGEHQLKLTTVLGDIDTSVICK